MIETKKIKSAVGIEEVISTIEKLSAEMETNMDFILALLRLSDRRALPILRSDLNQEDIIALLLTILAQEQRKELAPIHWNMVFGQVWSHMSEDQRNQMLEKVDLHLN